MRIVILKRREYLEDIAISGRIEMHVKEELCYVWTAFIWL
jgi:hypothetical protein